MCQSVGSGSQPETVIGPWKWGRDRVGLSPQLIGSETVPRSIVAELDWERLVDLGHHRIVGSRGMWGQPHVYHRHLTVDSDFTFAVMSGQIERHAWATARQEKKASALKTDTGLGSPGVARRDQSSAHVPSLLFIMSLTGCSL